MEEPGSQGRSWAVRGRSWSRDSDQLFLSLVVLGEKLQFLQSVLQVSFDESSVLICTVLTVTSWLVCHSVADNMLIPNSDDNVIHWLTLFIGSALIYFTELDEIRNDTMKSHYNINSLTEHLGSPVCFSEICKHKIKN